MDTRLITDALAGAPLTLIALMAAINDARRIRDLQRFVLTEIKQFESNVRADFHRLERLH
jgi:hypothetical protein